MKGTGTRFQEKKVYIQTPGPHQASPLCSWEKCLNLRVSLHPGNEMSATELEEKIYSILGCVSGKCS